MIEILYDKVKAAQYMGRLLRAKYFNAKNCNFYEYLSAIGVNLRHLIKNVIEDVKNSRGTSEKSELLNNLLRVKNSPLRIIIRDFNDIVDEYPHIEHFIRENALKYCERISKYQPPDKKNYELARKKFEKIFGLSSDAMNFLEFALPFGYEPLKIL